MLRLIAQGFSNKEIAARLDVGIKSVESYKALGGTEASASPASPTSSGTRCRRDGSRIAEGRHGARLSRRQHHPRLPGKSWHGAEGSSRQTRPGSRQISSYPSLCGQGPRSGQAVSDGAESHRLPTQGRGEWPGGTTLPVATPPAPGQIVPAESRPRVKLAFKGGEAALRDRFPGLAHSTQGVSDWVLQQRLQDPITERSRRDEDRPCGRLVEAAPDEPGLLSKGRDFGWIV